MCELSKTNKQTNDKQSYTPPPPQAQGQWLGRGLMGLVTYRSSRRGAGRAPPRQGSARQHGATQITHCSLNTPHSSLQDLKTFLPLHPAPQGSLAAC